MLHILRMRRLNSIVLIATIFSPNEDVGTCFNAKFYYCCKIYVFLCIVVICCISCTEGHMVDWLKADIIALSKYCINKILKINK